MNEAACDGDATFVQSAVSGAEDLYAYAALHNLGTIAGIQVNTICRQTDVTAKTLITPVQSGGVGSEDTAQGMSTSLYESNAQSWRPIPARQPLGPNPASMRLKSG